MGRNTAFYVAPITTPAPTGYGLFDLDGAWLPATLGAIETRKRRSFFRTDEDYSRGYQALSEMEWRLLMDASEAIILELRSLRSGPVYGRDISLETSPPGMFDAPSVETLVNLLYLAPNSAAELLTQIRDTLAASGEGSAEQLELLGQLVLLMGV